MHNLITPGANAPTSTPVANLPAPVPAPKPTPCAPCGANGVWVVVPPASYSLPGQWGVPSPLPVHTASLTLAMLSKAKGQSKKTLQQVAAVMGLTPQHAATGYTPQHHARLYGKYAGAAKTAKGRGNAARTVALKMLARLKHHRVPCALQVNNNTGAYRVVLTSN